MFLRSAILPAAVPLAAKTGYSGYAVGDARLPVLRSSSAVLGGRVWKREAEADPEADPSLIIPAATPAATVLAANPWLNAGLVGAPLLKSVSPIVATKYANETFFNSWGSRSRTNYIFHRTILPAASPLIGSPLLGSSLIGSPLIGSPVIASSPLVSSHIWKREAKAEPEADADAGLIAPYGIAANPWAINNPWAVKAINPWAAPLVKTISPVVTTK